MHPIVITFSTKISFFSFSKQTFWSPESDLIKKLITSSSSVSKHWLMGVKIYF